MNGGYASLSRHPLDGLVVWNGIPKMKFSSHWVIWPSTGLPSGWIPPSTGCFGSLEGLSAGGFRQFVDDLVDWDGVRRVNFSSHWVIRFLKSRQMGGFRHLPSGSGGQRPFWRANHPPAGISRRFAGGFELPRDRPAAHHVTHRRIRSVQRRMDRNRFGRSVRNRIRIGFRMEIAHHRHSRMPLG